MDKIITLFDYHRWAMNRMIDYVENELGEHRFTQEVESVFSSIRETMEHIYTVDKLWFGRIQKNAAANEISFANTRQARSSFNKLHNEMMNYLNENDKEQQVLYTNSTGDSFENRLQDIFYHLVNHGTYHRGNITAMIRSMGLKSVSTDFIFYLREKEMSN